MIVPAIAQNTSINQTEIKNLETSINELHDEHAKSDLLALYYAVSTFLAGGALAILFFYAHTKQSDKIEKITNEVREVVKNQNKLIEDQDTIRKKRIRMAVEGISIGLNGLKKHVESRKQSLTNYYSGIPKPTEPYPFEDEKGFADYVKENIIKYNCENAKDVLDPELYRDVLRVSSRIFRIYELISQEYDIKECNDILTEIERIEKTPLLKEYGVVF